MAWVKVPPENHPLFLAALAALPKTPRVEAVKMFGGVAARVNGHLFAGLFGRSVILQLAEPDKAAALALEGAGLFDPMGEGRVRSDKVMLPEQMMDEPEELRSWIGRAFKFASALPPKAANKTGGKPAGRSAAKPTPAKAAKAVTKKAVAKRLRSR